jgi:hypothetical protein
MIKVISNRLYMCEDTQTSESYCGTGCCNDIITKIVTDPSPFDGKEILLFRAISEEGLCENCAEKGLVCAYPNASKGSRCDSVSEESEVPIKGFSIYQARKDNDLITNKIAYQFLPSDLKFNLPSIIHITYNNQDFKEEGGIKVYRYEDYAFNLTILDSISSEIGVQGGIIKLGDTILTIPTGALSQATNITINQVKILKQPTNISQEEVNSGIINWIIGSSKSFSLRNIFEIISKFLF